MNRCMGPAIINCRNVDICKYVAKGDASSYAQPGPSDVGPTLVRLMNIAAFLEPRA